jgi:hypothetical protein
MIRSIDIRVSLTCVLFVFMLVMTMRLVLFMAVIVRVSLVVFVQQRRGDIRYSHAFSVPPVQPVGYHFCIGSFFSRPLRRRNAASSYLAYVLYAYLQEEGDVRPVSVTP